MCVFFRASSAVIYACTSDPSALWLLVSLLRFAVVRRRGGRRKEKKKHNGVVLHLDKGKRWEEQKGGARCRMTEMFGLFVNQPQSSMGKRSGL